MVVGGIVGQQVARGIVGFCPALVVVGGNAVRILDGAGVA